jgi:hypothetical protein
LSLRAFIVFIIAAFAVGTAYLYFVKWPYLERTQASSEASP